MLGSSSLRFGLLLLPLGVASCQGGCSSDAPATAPAVESPSAIVSSPTTHPAATAAIKPGPIVSADYAFEKILQYEKFGPKIPGTAAHQKAGDWIVAELNSLGNIEVTEQKATAKTFDGKTIPIRNIIAQINPSAKKRYLLSAHWDNRPFADQESDPKKLKKPVPGVNDGGSGVAVLLAIAKAVTADWYRLGSPYAKSSEKIDPPFGIDFAFWDAEDWGNPRGAPETYCLGSQYWAKNRVPAGYQAEFGINFDMVGRVGSLFPAEGHSLHKAPHVVKAIREAAVALGHEALFPNTSVGPITDDHFFVMQGTAIPMADIIYMDPDGLFPPEWHTTDDTSAVISRDVLQAVAQVAVQVIFR